MMKFYFGVIVSTAIVFCTGFVVGIGPTASYLAAAETAVEDQSESEFKTVLDAKVAKIESGSVKRNSQPAYLGVLLESRESTLVVEEVAADSPADKAGFKVGDVLKTVGKEKVSSQEEFRSALTAYSAKDKLKFQVDRGEDSVELDVELAAVSNPRQIGRTQSRRGILGVQVEPSKEPKGTRVQSVYDGSGADDAGLQVGDVIIKFDEHIVDQANSLIRRLLRTKPGDKVTLLVNRDKKEIEMEVELRGDFGRSTSSRGNSSRGNSSRNTSGRAKRWQEGAYKLAVIGVEYPDQKHNEKVTLKDWQASMFSEGQYNDRSPTGQRVYGSLNDYYRELSAGKFSVEGKFFDWVEVSNKRQDYMKGNRSALMTEAMDLILEQDGEDALKGYDGVFFLYAGNRVPTQRGGLYWPHRGSLTHKRKRWSYFIMQEGGNRMSDISVMCHEFGHMLGLPDLYSKDARAEGLSVWCAMSNQAGRGRPQHFSAWCKEQLGWLKPTVIDPRDKQKLILSPVERSANECFKVLLQPDGSEYLLLENRRQFGFDASLPSEGLLIWRVVNNRPVLEESHGIAGPAGPQAFRDAVPYPSSSNNSFTPYTTPSSKAKSGEGLPVHITNIRELSDGRVSFYIGYEFQ